MLLVNILRLLYRVLEIDEIDKLRKGIIAYESDPKLAMNFFLKAISSGIDTCAIENLRKGIATYDDDPALAMIFFLKAVSEDVDTCSIENLRKGIIAYYSDPALSMNFFLKIVYEKTKLNSIDNLRKTVSCFPNGWGDVFSQGQVESKIWLLSEFRRLDINDSCLAYIYGGWYGALPFIANLMDCHIANNVKSFDIDQSCRVVAESLNKDKLVNDWAFKAETKNVIDISFPHNYLLTRANGTSCEVTESPDIIINTSCEHMGDEWFLAIDNKVLVILQSNNFYSEDGHINCVNGLAELKTKFSLSNILFEGELELQNYSRYMLIGYK